MPDLQLTPNHILECPTVATKLLKMGMVPLRDSLRKILYSPDAPRIAEAVIKTFDRIYCIYSWTREQQQLQVNNFIYVAIGCFVVSSLGRLFTPDLIRPRSTKSGQTNTRIYRSSVGGVPI
ncbi:hypothetical protein TNCV_101531 [Trichonephila clavipes]|nr:hypothetical protein TNCV_101531 [Trichonephila clavipes]